MRRDDYEMLLLELRQVIKEKEDSFKTEACVHLIYFKSIKHFKQLVHSELKDYRLGFERKQKFVKLMEG